MQTGIPKGACCKYFFKEPTMDISVVQTLFDCIFFS